MIFFLLSFIHMSAFQGCFSFHKIKVSQYLHYQTMALSQAVYSENLDC